MDLTPEQRQQIYEEEKIARAVEVRRPFLKLAIGGIATLIALGGLGSLAYQQYQLRGLKQKLGEAIGKDLGLTETILKIETDSTKMTFGELFELCNKSVENRTNLIVELRGLYPEVDYELKSKLVDYLSAENEFVRSKRGFYQKAMEQSSAVDSYVEQLKDTPSSSYGYDYYRDRVAKLKVKVIEAISATQAGSDEFIASYEKMAKEEVKISKQAHDAGLRFDPVFAKHAKSNKGKADEAKKSATQLAAAF